MIGSEDWYSGDGLKTTLKLNLWTWRVKSILYPIKNQSIFIYSFKSSMAMNVLDF